MRNPLSPNSNSFIGESGEEHGLAFAVLVPAVGADAVRLHAAGELDQHGNAVQICLLTPSSAIICSAVQKHYVRIPCADLPLAAALDGPVRLERADRRFVGAAVRAVLRLAEDDEIPLSGLAGVQDEFILQN